MHPAQIKAALAVAGYKQVELAREIGLREATVSAVIHGRGRSKAVEGRIAEITGVPPAELWPQWYGEKPLTLTGIERELVLAFRAADAAAQRRALRNVGAGSVDDDEPGQHGVHASHGSIAAGGNVNVGSKPRSRTR